MKASEISNVRFGSRQRNTLLMSKTNNKKVKLTLGVREAEMLVAMAEQMVGDMTENSLACGYSALERDRFFNALDKLVSATRKAGGFR